MNSLSIRAVKRQCFVEEKMDQDLAALFKLLDSHIKGIVTRKTTSLNAFCVPWKKKYEKQKEFIRNLGCSAHVGLKMIYIVDSIDLP